MRFSIKTAVLNKKWTRLLGHIVFLYAKYLNCPYYSANDKQRDRWDNQKTGKQNNKLDYKQPNSQTDNKTDKYLLFCSTLTYNNNQIYSFLNIMRGHHYLKIRLKKKVYVSALFLLLPLYQKLIQIILKIHKIIHCKMYKNCI